jgi:predicted dehydrogenase
LSEGEILRLGIIGLETTHGYIYPAMINGYDPEKFQATAPEIVSSIFPTEGAPSVEGAQVVACYDENMERARDVAQACLIERVCSNLEEVLQGVDGVLITSGDANGHRILATPALELGLATFVDKPFSAHVDDASAMIELSDQRAAPLFCSSAVRFAHQTVAFQRLLEEGKIGAPLNAHVIGTGDFESYAVHSLELLVTVWGAAVTHLRSIGKVGSDTIQLLFDGEREAIWQIRREVDWMFHLSLFGTDGMASMKISFSDRYEVFKEMTRRIVSSTEQRQSPVPLEETLQIVRLLELARRHRGDGELIEVL